MRVLIALMALLLSSCEPTLADGEIRCGRAGECPAGFACNSSDERCYRSRDASSDGGVDAAVDSAMDAAVDAVADVRLDSNDDAFDAGPPLGLTPVWMVALGSTGADNVTSLALQGSQVVVAAIAGSGAMFGDATLNDSGGTRGLVFWIDSMGTLVSSAVVLEGTETRVRDIVVSGSDVFAVGEFLGTLSTGEAAVENDGWLGRFDTTSVTTLGIVSGDEDQTLSAIVQDEGTLFAGGDGSSTINFAGQSDTASNNDGIIAQIEAEGTMAALTLIDGDGPGRDQILAVANDPLGGNFYAGGRVDNGPGSGSDGLVMRTGFSSWTQRLTSTEGAVVSVRALTSPGRDQVCAGGQYAGTLDVIAGAADGDAGFVACWDSADALIWAEPFDGVSVDRVLALDSGAGLLAVGGIFESTLGSLSAVDLQDAFVAVLDPTTGDAFDQVAIGATGTISVTSIVIERVSDELQRIYVGGAFDDAPDPFGSTSGLTTAGGQDGFVALFEYRAE